MARFILEFAAVVSVAYWGYRVASGPRRWLLAIGAATLLIVVWALVISPDANVPISQDVRAIIGSVVLLIAAAALYAAGQRTLAMIFATVIILNTILIFVPGEG